MSSTQLSRLVLLLTLAWLSQGTVYSQSPPKQALLNVLQSGAEDAFLNEGERYFAQGDWAAAEAHFKAASKSQQANPLWYVCLALALDKQGKSDQARSEVKKLIDIGEVESLVAYVEKAKTGKIAFVDTRTFADKVNGIKRYVAATKAVDDEFKGVLDELANIKRRIEAIENELASSTQTIDTDASRAKRDEVRKLQRELERKRKEAELAVRKRLEKVTGPIAADIGKALNAYAKERNIAVIFDRSLFPEVRYFADKSVDVTQDFVATYNALNSN